MQNTVKERLVLYIKFKRIAVNRFEKVCGLSTGYVRNMRVSIQPDKLSSIALNFPDLNTGWLMTGEGEMLKQTGEQPQANEPMEGCACPFTESMKGILENMTAICDVNKKLVEQQSDLIAAIKALAAKR